MSLSGRKRLSCGQWKSSDFLLAFSNNPDNNTDSGGESRAFRKRQIEVI